MSNATDPAFLATVDSALYNAGVQAGYVAAFQAMYWMAYWAEIERQRMMLAAIPVAPATPKLVHAPAADSGRAARHLHYCTFGRSGNDSIRKGPTKAEADAKAEADRWGISKAA